VSPHQVQPSDGGNTTSSTCRAVGEGPQEPQQRIILLAARCILCQGRLLLAGAAYVARSYGRGSGSYVTQDRRGAALDTCAAVALPASCSSCLDGPAGRPRLPLKPEDVRQLQPEHERGAA